MYKRQVLHPNAGAVLVVGLGCENNQPDVFREFLGEYDEDRVKFMVTQKVGEDVYKRQLRYKDKKIFRVRKQQHKKSSYL